MANVDTGVPKSHWDVDESVVARASSGEATALAQIYDTYSRDIFRYHYSRAGNKSDAEDLTSQTFMAVLEALPRYRPRGRFSAWIFQIARNKAMDFFRRRKLDPANISLDIACFDDPLDRVARKELYEQLITLVRSLDAEERELIRLRYVVHLSLVQIAELMERKEDAVRKRLNRLLERLSRQMEVKNG